MKLFLSSAGLGANPQTLRKLGGSNTATAVILAALDAQVPDFRESRRKAESAALQNLGLLPEEVDLRNYFGKPDALRKRLERFGYIWVAGGNTFTLRRAFALSGLDDILTSWRSRDDFVYAGYSAGACVVTPTLKGIQFADSPNEQPAGYTGELIWDGLGFVPFSIIPHYLEQYPKGSPRDNEIRFLIENKLPFIVLKDSEVHIGEVH